MNNTTKYIIKTDTERTYILYIMNASEYSGDDTGSKYVGLFLFYDDGTITGYEELWKQLRHRLLFENSVDAIKEKIKEYASGRNEEIVFLEIDEKETNRLT